MSMGTIYASTYKEFTSNIILCPSHLVKKWNDDLNESYPMAQTVICTSLSMFQNEIEPLLKNKNRRSNLFIIISKEIAKNDLELEPAVLYKPNHSRIHTQSSSAVRYSTRIYNKFMYQCPECGLALSNDIDFMVKPKHNFNIYCPNCGTKLWKPALGKESKWVKLTPTGWYPRKSLSVLKNELKDRIDNGESSIDYKKRVLYTKLLDYSANDGKVIERKSRTYSLAKYIYKNYKNKIDYLIADELHQYSSSNSIQGEMFALMNRTAKHTIGLTGTLINGYASNLFSLLFRMFSRSMIEYGYGYHNSGKFIEDFGVVKETEKLDPRTSSVRVYKKYSPGISPLVFTNFLLNNCVFISLEDMSDNLPPYIETPLAVTLDDDIMEKYNSIKSSLKNTIQSYINQTNSTGSERIILQAVNTMSVYVDQPYDIQPIYDYDTNNIVLDFPEVEIEKERITNKERVTLDIAKESLSRNERVLIYYHWTNKTDCAQRLKNMFESNGYDARILTSSVKAKDRQQWIADNTKNGMQVLLCNPALIETGLDLLDYTTIIWYQIGYKLNTVRQGSYRSRRLNQRNPVHVYFLYYKNTIQEQALAMMSTKMSAAVALEGKFNEEGLAALVSNTGDIMSQLAKSIINDENLSVEANSFVNIESDNDLVYHFGEEVNATRDIIYNMFNYTKKIRKKQIKSNLPILYGYK